MNCPTFHVRIGKNVTLKTVFQTLAEKKAQMFPEVVAEHSSLFISECFLVNSRLNTEVITVHKTGMVLEAFIHV